MKKLILLLIPLLMIAFADPDPSYGAGKLSRWIKSVVHKMGVFKAKKEDRVVSSVAGVKGAEDEGDELYWKKWDISVEETDAFDAAVGHAQEGHTDKAIEGLEAFIADYPESPLVADAREGIEALSEESGGGDSSVEEGAAEEGAAEEHPAEEHPAEEHPE